MRFGAKFHSDIVDIVEYMGSRLKSPFPSGFTLHSGVQFVGNHRRKVPFPRVEEQRELRITVARLD